MAAGKPLARVLLVEDYEDARVMYSEMLRLGGYEVVTAQNGQEALELVAKEHFDLIVLDISLPRVDGLTVLRTLRRQPRTQYIPVITLSASVGHGLHKAVLSAGANLALDKPCLPDDLAAAVRSLLLTGAG